MTMMLREANEAETVPPPGSCCVLPRVPSTTTSVSKHPEGSKVAKLACTDWSDCLITVTSCASAMNGSTRSPDTHTMAISVLCTVCLLSVLAVPSHVLRSQGVRQCPCACTLPSEVLGRHVRTSLLHR